MSALIAIRWILGCLIGVLGVSVILGNWVIIGHGLFKGKRESIIPLVGGVAGVLAIVLLPIPLLHVWWFLPVLLDWGSGLGVLYGAGAMLVSFLKGKGDRNNA